MRFYLREQTPIPFMMLAEGVTSPKKSAAQVAAHLLKDNSFSFAHVPPLQVERHLVKSVFGVDTDFRNIDETPKIAFLANLSFFG